MELIEQVNMSIETQESVVLVDEDLPFTKKKGHVSALLGDLFKDDGAHPTTQSVKKISQTEVHCAED